MREGKGSFKQDIFIDFFPIYFELRLFYEISRILIATKKGRDWLFKYVILLLLRMFGD